MGLYSRAVLIVIIGAAIASTSPCRQQAPEKKVCTDKDANLAIEASTSPSNWEAMYQVFKKFGHCDDGAIAEGYDDTVVRLLAKDWRHVDALVRLVASDKSFERFVLQHISETVPDDELDAAANNVKTACPAGQSRLCGAIEARARSAFFALQHHENLVLGVLEDNPGRFQNDPNSRAVRAVFQKIGDEWKPLRDHCPDQACLKTVAAQYPKEVVWTIAFDGRNLGQVKTRAPVEFKSYADIGLEEITSGEPVPTVGKRSANNGGFGGGEVYRPLVAVSAPNYADPDVWKPTNLQVEMIAAVRREFRKKFPKATNCKNPDENIQRPWLYRDEDVSVNKSYASQSKWFLVELKLKGWRCDGAEDDGGPFDGHWYVIEPEGTVRFLDAGMWLVDAGDYDNDGKSEIVFSIGRYDQGGYEVFYNDFKKHAVFTYIFH
jgi:hypothetical protein